MKRSTRISLAMACAAGAAAAAGAPAAVATGHAKTVTIRIEGAKRTLLPAKAVAIPASGSVTKFGAPRGACPDRSATGVLNAATHGHWRASWSKSFNDYFITNILGDTESSKTSYWEILVNDKPAVTGACEIKLHAGDDVVFAAVPVTGSGLALVVKAPAHAVAGRTFAVKVDDVDAKGHLKPLAGATVTGRGIKATTDSHGIAHLTVVHSGRVTLEATDAGYVRAQAVTVKLT